MRNRFVAVLVLAALPALVAAAVACDDTQFEPPAFVVQIVLGIGDCGRLLVGETCTLEATALGSDGSILPDAQLVWESRNVVIATVDVQGRVTGRNEGDATIVASSTDGVIASQTTVSVEENPAPLPDPDE